MGTQILNHGFKSWASLLWAGLILLSGSVCKAHADEPSPSVQLSTPPVVQGGYIYTRPKFFDFIKKVPCDLIDCGGEIFKKENLLPLGAIVASTGLLIVFDQRLVDGAHKAGDQWGITHSNNMKPILKIPLPFTKQKARFEGPHDSGSALYFIGDGWTDLYVAAGFATTGLITSDNRALQTSSQIVESIIASGITTQLLKHVTGRESPYVATESGGRWHPLPNQSEYRENVPHYDAFPSGHLAAAMATLTVVGTNYPEYHFIYPLGYTMMGALAFQMMNNGVHWASDYPLALAIGYSFGKIAARHGRRKATASDSAKSETSLSIIVVNRSPGVGFRRRF